MDSEATMAANKFLRFHTNLSNQNYANCAKIRSHVHMRQFIIPICGCSTSSRLSDLTFWWVKDKLPE